MPCRCRGQIGTTLADLKLLIDEVDNPQGRLQVCVDLNHVYTAQVDFTTPAGLEILIAAIDHVGIHNITAFHLSDSGYQHGSAGDAHVDFGRGYIGIDAYRRLLRHPIFSQVPTIFEVPPYCTTFRQSTLKGTTIPENLRKLDDLNQELFELIIQMSDRSWEEYGKRVIKHYYFVEIRIRQRIRQAAIKLGDAAYQAFQEDRQQTSNRNRAIARGKETGGVKKRKARDSGLLSGLGIIPKDVCNTPRQTTRGGKKYGAEESEGTYESDSINDSGSLDESESDGVRS
ncbi:xylose isomerase-like protein [Naematelia encephala]|uniref:Xylose isomerase-like protein n=1 Tax=Naematelia encephala TaxID=71784 RepID=A0A1Y2BAP8_9TREE|nr:xylose isomerase-like protein [Naematelia encephala]